MDFDALLKATLTPIALISGVGLLLLSLVNRFNHALDRVRQVHRETDLRDATAACQLAPSGQILFRRCVLLRNAILCIAGSMLTSAAMVCLTVLEGILAFSSPGVKIGLLVSALLLIVASTILFLMDITCSLTALRLDLGLRTAPLSQAPTDGASLQLDRRKRSLLERLRTVQQ